jgi:hypothetical protein
MEVLELEKDLTLFDYPTCKYCSGQIVDIGNLIVAAIMSFRKQAAEIWMNEIKRLIWVVIEILILIF